MALTSQASDALANHLYRNSLYPSPEIWLGFLDSQEQELNSVTNPGYVRVRLNDKMGVPENGISISNFAVEFPFATQNWETTIVSAGIWDSQTTGTLLQRIRLSQPTNITANFSIRFPAGQIILGFGTIPDGCWRDGNRVYPFPVILEFNNEVILAPEPSNFTVYQVQVES